MLCNAAECHKVLDERHSLVWATRPTGDAVSICFPRLFAYPRTALGYAGQKIKIVDLAHVIIYRPQARMRNGIPESINYEKCFNIIQKERHGLCLTARNATASLPLKLPTPNHGPVASVSSQSSPGLQASPRPREGHHPRCPSVSGYSSESSGLSVSSPIFSCP
jgi:hypothetical protein